MTEAMPFLQKYDITFLRPPTIRWRPFLFEVKREKRIEKRNGRNFQWKFLFYISSISFVGKGFFILLKGKSVIHFN